MLLYLLIFLHLKILKFILGKMIYQYFSNFLLFILLIISIICIIISLKIKIEYYFIQFVKYQSFYLHY